MNANYRQTRGSSRSSLISLFLDQGPRIKTLNPFSPQCVVSYLLVESQCPQEGVHIVKLCVAKALQPLWVTGLPWQAHRTDLRTEGRRGPVRRWERADGELHWSEVRNKTDEWMREELHNSLRRGEILQWHKMNGYIVGMVQVESTCGGNGVRGNMYM